MFQHFIHYSQPGQAGSRVRGYACHNCRRKKIRCDGARPACNNCAKQKVECKYSTRDLSSVHNIIPLTPSHSNPITQSTRVIYAVHGTRSAKEHSKDIEKGSHRSDGDAVVPSASTKPELPEAENTDFVHSNPSTFSFWDWAHALNEGSTRKSGSTDWLLHQVIINAEIQQCQLLDYFEYHFPLCYPLHLPVFLQQVMKNQAPPALLYSIYAVVTRFSRRPQVVIHEGVTVGQRYLRMSHRLIREEQHHKPTAQLALASGMCALAAGIMLDTSLALQLCALCMDILKGVNVDKLLDGVEWTQLSERPSQEALAIEALRRTYMSSLAVFIVCNIVFDMVDSRVGIPREYIWATNDEAWISPEANIAHIFATPNDQHTFTTLGTMFTCQQLADMQSVFVTRHQLLNEMQVDPHCIQEIHSELWQGLQRMRTNDATAEQSYRGQPSRVYSHPHEARYVGIKVLLPFTEATVYHTLLNLEIDYPTYTGMMGEFFSSTESGIDVILKAGRTICDLIQNHAEVPIEYTHDWIPHVVFLVKQILTNYVDAPTLGSETLSLTNSLCDGLAKYLFQYKNHWDTNFKLNYQDMENVT
ncbi:hypothetical protein IWQ62_003081 [Dispira parvispora]|uniref:Zn(2)-C6 fungal-type domain-containing protein n=1 Tax=Dispira parvispora TaxID=1520584 RepID=A0A9W8E384_9FUNG|nr:hypothetical protein IWQ62_003081 [Dispira parvispora]